MRSSILKNSLFHLPFLLVIGGLMVWIRDEKARQLDENTLHELGILIRANQSTVLDRLEFKASDDIENCAVFNNNPQNRSVKNQSLRLRAIEDTVQQRLFQLHCGLEAKQTSLSRLLKWYKTPEWQAFSDTLTAFCNSDSTAMRAIRTTLFGANESAPPAWWTTFMKTASREAAHTFLHCQAWNSQYARIRTLRNLAETRVDRSHVSSIMPEILLLKPRSDIIPNHAFDAAIQWKTYGDTRSNVAIQVNHKDLPIEAGLAHYRTTYNQPGRHKILVDIRLTNPLTGDVKLYEKDFAIPVSGTCAQTN